MNPRPNVQLWIQQLGIQLLSCGLARDLDAGPGLFVGQLQLRGIRIADNLPAGELRVLHCPRSSLRVAVAILTLALGIGANTAIFSLLDALVLRSLPVHRPEQLVEINASYRQKSQMPLSLSLSLYQQLVVSTIRGRGRVMRSAQPCQPVPTGTGTDLVLATIIANHARNPDSHNSIDYPA